MSRHEPFGYRKTKDGLEPIPDELAALEKAKFYLEAGCSMYQMQKWLVDKTGRQITVPGMLKIMGFNGRKKAKSRTEKNNSDEASTTDS